MRYIILSLISIISLQLFSQTSPEYKEKKYNNGELMYKGYFQNGKPIGEFKRYYESGIIKAKLNYKSTYAYAELYNERGNKIAEGRYKESKKDSTWLYYKAQNVIAKDNYFNGVKHGLCTVYNEDGTKYEEAMWEKGIKHGMWNRYYQDGQLKIEANYKQSKLDGKLISYNNDGSKSTEGNYIENKKDGDWIYYDERGDVRIVVIYKKGVPNKRLDEESILYLENQNKKEQEYIDPEKNPDEYLIKMGNLR